MTARDTIEQDRSSDWTLMNALHDAFRRDLDELCTTSAGAQAVRERWEVFRDQLHFHHAAEDQAMWPPVRARLAGNAGGIALLDAMEEEHALIDPLLTAVDDALAAPTDPARRGDLLTRLQDTLTSHLAHEEAEALPLISTIMTRAELAAIGRAIFKMGGLSQAAVMFPWALSGASPQARAEVLGQLPAPARLLYRALWLPRYLRKTPRL